MVLDYILLVTSIIVSFFVISYLKFSFVVNVAEGKKIKRFSKEDWGCYFYFLWHGKLIRTLRLFSKDTFKVLVDTLIITLLIYNIVNLNLLVVLFLIFLRLIIFIIIDGVKTDKLELNRTLKRDLESYIKFRKSHQ